MNRKIAAIWLSLAMVFGFVVILVEVAPVIMGSTIIYVDDEPGEGPGNPAENYTSIQEAIDNADEGDTVFVYSGIYYEYLIVNKTMNLTGENRESTIINGSGIGDVVYVDVDWVNITGFTITGSRQTSGDAGIDLYAVHNCSIYNNNISGNEDGISFRYSSENRIFNNNISHNRAIGISLSYSNGNNITQNNGSYNWHGINLFFSCENNILGNYMSLSVGDGISIQDSSNNKITENIVTLNEDRGIYLWFSSNNSIHSNNVTMNLNGIRLWQSDDNNITDNYIIQNNWSGIYFSYSQRNNISNNDISQNYNGIVLGTSSHYNNISDNNISLNDECGIHLSQSRYNNITHNNVSKNYKGMISWQSSHSNISNNNILNNDNCGISLETTSNNTLDNNIFINNGIVISGGGIRDFNSHIIPSNNLVNRKPLFYYKDSNNTDINGISIGQLVLANCTSFDVRNLQINNTDVGIIVAYSSNITIKNNEIFLNNMYGLYFTWLSNSQIVSNNVYSNDYQGLYLNKGMSNNISHNNVLNNGRNGLFDSGIYLFTSSYNNITSNNVSNNGNNGLYNSGIYLYLSSYNTIINNNVSTKNGSGIFTGYPSNNNLITKNNVSKSDYGIFIYESSNNSITCNDVNSNKLYGIYIRMASHNRVYHNNLTANTNQAYDDQGDNNWDNGYPWGGNYWSDYSGIDNNKGPNQNISGSDGIGDTPYTNLYGGGGAQDNYPLMNPHTPPNNYLILKQGWNLISIPLIQEEQNLTRVLGSIDGWYDAVQFYDITDNNDPWKHYKVGKPYGNDLFKLNESMGFWIHITQPGDTIFLYNGTQPSENKTITLHSGWNMVGYPSLTRHNRTEGLNNLTFDTHVDAIWTFNSMIQKWEKMGSTDNFEIGRGYYIHAKTKCEWVVPL
ncbi:MAG: right-handed parallel beta-helix repeat-containing protein [Thermoplasmata archaeon]|nr:MAG: right-handed parallel beta-helix repeat-containing protein [Thermoplasmata archaeon]